MRIEVKTRGRVTRAGDPEVIVQVAIVPRGGTNRPRARKLAAAVRQVKELEGHIKRVVVGSSSISIHMRASFDLPGVFDLLLRRMKEEEAGASTLPLFGTG